jgi:hypothetical protein
MSKGSTFSVSDRVRSATFGDGTISRMDEKYTTIDFDEGSSRRFLTSLVQLSRTDTLAPTKPERAKAGKRG